MNILLKEINIEGKTKVLCNRSEKKPPNTKYDTGCVFFPAPPKKLEYKIPLYPLALREISDQLIWDLVL